MIFSCVFFFGSVIYKYGNTDFFCINFFLLKGKKISMQLVAEDFAGNII